MDVARRSIPTPAAVLVAALVLVSCGDSSPSGPGGELAVSPDATLLVGVGETDLLSVEGSGSGTVTWTSSDPSIVTVSDGLVTAVGAGTATVTASRGSASGTATVEVYLPPEVAEYLPGESYLGRRDYVEYVPGTLPVVVSAPHGGSLQPSEISPRQGGVQVTDLRTLEQALQLRGAFLDLYGAAPHLVVLHLDRDRLDANRALPEAAEGNPFAEQAWAEYHGFVETARATVEDDWGTGLYLDLHGHGHEIQRIELGYLLAAVVLNRSDESINSGSHASSSSLAALHERRAAAGRSDFAALLRGPSSMGGFLGVEGYPSVPSPDEAGPGNDPYFSGGYSTVRHGSRDGGTIDGIQLELHWTGLRDTPANRRGFGEALARSVAGFVTEHYGHAAPFAVAPPCAVRGCG